jgi:hypothetical protein
MGLYWFHERNIAHFGAKRKRETHYRFLIDSNICVGAFSPILVRQFSTESQHLNAFLPENPLFS